MIISQLKDRHKEKINTLQEHIGTLKEENREYQGTWER